MGTLTGSTPELAEHCPHKLPTSCRLTATSQCCACQDKRPHSARYQIYVDGVGMVSRGTRWQRYCWFCKTFWENRIRAIHPPIDSTDTQIPNDPDQSEFLTKWFEFHRGYRVGFPASNNEHEVRIPVTPEKPWSETAPGQLPLLDERLSINQSFHERRATTIEVDHVALDATLDELLVQADDEDDTTETRPSSRIATTSNARTDTNVTQLAEDRMQETRAQIAAAEERKRMLREQIQLVDQELREFRERRARLSREQRTAQAFARVFGTREDIQSQGDNYVSPLASMFGRAYDRFRIAEEVRAEERASDLNVERHRLMLERLQIPNWRAAIAAQEGSVLDEPQRTLDDVDSGRPPPLSDEQMMAKLDCKICLQQRADTAVLPCGHLIMCSYCAAIAIPGRPEDPLQPLRRSSQCPLCKKNIRRMARIFLA